VSHDATPAALGMEDMSTVELSLPHDTSMMPSRPRAGSITQMSPHRLSLPLPTDARRRARTLSGGDTPHTASPATVTIAATTSTSTSTSTTTSDGSAAAATVAPTRAPPSRSSDRRVISDTSFGGSIDGHGALMFRSAHLIPAQLFAMLADPAVSNPVRTP
jgi:hypothetical protein